MRLVLAVYKRAISPLLHAIGGLTGGLAGACRFQPTCSEYAALAVAVHGPVRGSWLALRRLLRCHPLCRGGFDPVPGTGFDRSAAGGPVSSGREPHHLP